MTSRTISLYESTLPADIRDKIIQQLEFVHAYKIYTCDALTHAFNPYNYSIMDNGNTPYSTLDMVCKFHLLCIHNKRRSTNNIEYIYKTISNSFANGGDSEDNEVPSIINTILYTASITNTKVYTITLENIQAFLYTIVYWGKLVLCTRDQY